MFLGNQRWETNITNQNISLSFDRYKTKIVTKQILQVGSSSSSSEALHVVICD